MLLVMKGESTNAFKYLPKLSFGKEMLKLLISILLPLSLVKQLRT